MTSNIILQYRIAIVISRFNKEISDNLLQGALDEFNQICKDSRSNIDIFDFHDFVSLYTDLNFQDVNFCWCVLGAI